LSIASLGTARVNVIDELDPMSISIFMEIAGPFGKAWTDLNTTGYAGSFFALVS